jgi:hypothetical protein
VVRGRAFRAGEDEQQQSTTTTTMTTMMHHEFKLVVVRNDIRSDHDLAAEGVNQIGGVDSKVS